MTKILKYSLDIQGSSEIWMPRDSRIISIQCQAHISTHQLKVWAIVDEAEPPVLRQFRIYGTGHILEPDPGEFLATVQAGQYVWHVFEVS